MTVREALDRAVMGDCRAAIAIADHLRCLGWTYKQTVAFVTRRRPSITSGDWEDMMQEGDHE